MTLQTLRDAWLKDELSRDLTQPELIADFFLPRFQAHLESLAEEVEKQQRNKPARFGDKIIPPFNYRADIQFDSGLTTASQIIRNSLKS